MYTHKKNIREVITSETGLKLIRNDFLEQCPLCGSGTGKKGTSAFSFFENGYKCFSCGSKGDAIVFIEKYRNMSKHEAISYFKSKYLGIEEEYNPFKNKVNKYNYKPTNTIIKKNTLKNESDKYNTLELWDIDIYDKDFSNDDFVKFLYSKFDNDKVSELIDRYDIRTSTKGTIFPYIDHKGEIRTVKRIQYKSNGKMNRQIDPLYLHKKLGGSNFKYQRCFFGEHLLPNHTDKIGIVESEKTAIIASIFLEDYLFLATGGKNLLHINNITNISYLLSTDIVLFPDHDKPDSKGITPFIKWSLLAEKLHDIGYDIKVSDTLEQENIPFGYDIADVFIDIEGVKVDRVDKVGLKPAPVLDRTLTKKRSTALDCVKVDRSVSFEKMDKKPIKPSTRLDNIQKTIDKSNQRYELERQKKLAQEQIRQRLDWVKDQIGEIDIPDHPVKVGILTYLDIPKAISVDIDIVERRMDDYAEAPLRRLEKLIDALTNQSFQVV